MCKCFFKSQFAALNENKKRVKPVAVNYTQATGLTFSKIYLLISITKLHLVREVSVNMCDLTGVTVYAYGIGILSFRIQIIIIWILGRRF